MTKKSGLADSPFFRPAVPSSPLPVIESSSALVPVFSDERAHERTDEHLNARTVEPSNTRTPEQATSRTPEQPITRSDERAHERTDEHLNARTVEHPARTVSRKSYDIYDDQAEAIDELVLKWGKLRKKYTTKGQVMRELLDEIIPTKRK